MDDHGTTTGRRWRAPRELIAGLKKTIHNLGDVHRARIQLWRARYDSSSDSAAVREMIDFAWERRADLPAQREVAR